MGNTSSRGVNGRRRHGSPRSHRPSPPPPPPTSQPQPQPLPETTANQYVFAAATPYPNPNRRPYYHQYPGGLGYYPLLPSTMPVPSPVPYDQLHRPPPHLQQPAPYVEHQKAVAIRNDVNLKKETLRMEPDEENPGRYLVCFTFDASVACSITIIFFAKEGEDNNLTPMKESLFAPVTVHFQQGLGQKFKQPSGTGIDFSMCEERELQKVDEFNEVYPLVVKAEASSSNQSGLTDENSGFGDTNSQITKALFAKANGEYRVRVVKQILWVNGMRYELQEIYGIGNSVHGDFDRNDQGKECVICLSEPQDTTVLPCRHMCMCSGCAKVLRFQTNQCPICRQPVERLLEIKVSNDTED